MSPDRQEGQQHWRRRTVTPSVLRDDAVIGIFTLHPTPTVIVASRRGTLLSLSLSLSLPVREWVSSIGPAAAHAVGALWTPRTDATSARLPAGSAMLVARDSWMSLVQPESGAPLGTPCHADAPVLSVVAIPPTASLPPSAMASGCLRLSLPSFFIATRTGAYAVTPSHSTRLVRLVDTPLISFSLIPSDPTAPYPPGTDLLVLLPAASSSLLLYPSGHVHTPGRSTLAALAMPATATVRPTSAPHELTVPCFTLDTAGHLYLSHCRGGAFGPTTSPSLSDLEGHAELARLLREGERERGGGGDLLTVGREWDRDGREQADRPPTPERSGSARHSHSHATPASHGASAHSPALLPSLSPFTFESEITSGRQAVGRRVWIERIESGAGRRVLLGRDRDRDRDRERQRDGEWDRDRDGSFVIVEYGQGDRVATVPTVRVVRGGGRGGSDRQREREREADREEERRLVAAALAALVDGRPALPAVMREAARVSDGAADGEQAQARGRARDERTADATPSPSLALHSNPPHALSENVPIPRLGGCCFAADGQMLVVFGARMRTLRTYAELLTTRAKRRTGGGFRTVSNARLVLVQQEGQEELVDEKMVARAVSVVQRARAVSSSLTVDALTADMYRQVLSTNNALSLAYFCAALSLSLPPWVAHRALDLLNRRGQFVARARLAKRLAASGAPRPPPPPQELKPVTLELVDRRAACAVCRLPAQRLPLVVYCFACGHGGHLACLRGWAAKSDTVAVCPDARCDCRCGQGKWWGKSVDLPEEAWQYNHEQKEG